MLQKHFTTTIEITSRKQFCYYSCKFVLDKSYICIEVEDGSGLVVVTVVFKVVVVVVVVAVALLVEAVVLEKVAKIVVKEVVMVVV